MNTKTARLSFLATALLCSASTMLWPVMTAQAGFEFKGATGMVASPSVPSSAAPAPGPAQVMKEELALPMPGENLSDLTPVKHDAPAATMKMPAASPAPASEHSVVAGFGRDLPLAIALEQIIPAPFAPAPAEDVKMGQTVTWEGGKPWPDVLAATLAPLGLQSKIDGKNVRIEPKTKPQFPTPDTTDIAVTDAAADTMEPIDLAPPHDMGGTHGTVATPGNMDTAMVDDLSPNQPRRNVMTQPAPDISEPPPPMISDSDLENGLDSPGFDYSPPTQSGQMAVPIAAAPPADTGRVDVWTALAGQDLRATLDAWSHRVNVKLVWESPYMYAVQDTDSGARPYSDAVTALLDQFSSNGVGPKPQATLYQGSGMEPAVLVIR
ncbi:MAG: TcpQ domain-containing protein [Pseudomonadota bacterium]